MCEENDPVGVWDTRAEHGNGDSVDDEYDSALRQLLANSRPTIEDFAGFLVNAHQEYRDFPTRCTNGLIRYGDVTRADKVLLAVTSLHDRDVVDGIAHALKEKGARTVDVLVSDLGEDRELGYATEIEGIMRTEPWWAKPRWYDYHDSVMNYAKENGYSMVIHGRGGPIPNTNAKGEALPFKFEAIPWQTKEVFLWPSTIFPSRLNYLINLKTWNMIYREGRGGKVRLTDPEGTDLEFTLHEKYYERALDERGGFGPKPAIGHLLSHPTPPLVAEDDTNGVVAGTTAHITRPFPRMKIRVENGKIKEIEGGGGYGDAWRKLLVETDSVQYPEFPRKGLFWLWEMAIGTNPKVRRPSNVLRIGSGGTEIERARSGVIHLGFGTRWRGDSERWASQRGIIYGHLHVHLLFPTYEVRTRNGESMRVIDNGRLKALDDPEVRKLASKYGDPDQLLEEDWIPRIPGINTSGKYEEYAAEPAAWIGRFG